jgi:ribosomal protein L19E
MGHLCGTQDVIGEYSKSEVCAVVRFCKQKVSQTRSQPKGSVCGAAECRMAERNWVMIQRAQRQTEDLSRCRKLSLSKL